MIIENNGWQYSITATTNLKLHAILAKCLAKIFISAKIACSFKKVVMVVVYYRNLNFIFQKLFLKFIHLSDMMTTS